MKPRQSIKPPTQAKFWKSRIEGKDKRGGGVVLDCYYTIHVRESSFRQPVLQEVEQFLSSYDGDDEIVY